VLACATAAHAKIIVTRDKDLLVLHEYLGIPIRAAADALQRLEAK
jgi:predicted nucleic acid-binding protein